MNRKQFLKKCACTLCSCAAIGALAPADATAADTQTPEDWRFPFIKKRYAKLLEILADKVDDTTFNGILRQLGSYCASTGALIQKHQGDVDGFISELKKQADVVYDREKGIITIVGPERDDCFCPLVDRHITSSKVCNCSLGWQQYTYETLLGKKVEVALTESILRGGKRCAFRIRTL